MSIVIVRPSSRVKQESVYLYGFASNVTSSCGEDGIISKIFEIMGIQNRYCIEFGAWDGKLFSNTWSLINNHGWGGLLIEGSPQRFADLQRTYAGNSRVNLANRFVDFDSNSLDVILREVGAPTDPDFVCIDIDGADFHVWDSMKAFRPRLVVIEFNDTIPNDVIFIQDKDMGVKQGSSLAAMVELGRSKGYELVCVVGGNAMFVPKEDFPKFGIADNSIDAMHAPEFVESRLFQLYDGTLVLAGCQHLIWHSIPIDQESIQVLPPQQRRYPA
jgi:hypothetical protein